MSYSINDKSIEISSEGISSTDKQVPSSKAVLELVDNYVPADLLSTRSLSDANNANTQGVEAHYLTTSASNKPSGTDHSLLALNFNSLWGTQLASDWRTKDLYYRTIENGVWKSWAKIWHSDNDGISSGLDAGYLGGKLYAYSQGLNEGANTVDPNVTDDEYIMTNHANSPGLGVYWHIRTQFYSSISTTGNRSQIAIEYNASGGDCRAFVRSCYDAVWTPWTRIDRGVVANDNYYTLAGGTTAYTVTVDHALTLYQPGITLKLKANVSSTGAITINVNSLGAKSLLKSDGTAFSNFVADSVYTVIYNGANFILQGEGGDSSNIVSAQRGSVVPFNNTTSYSYDQTISSVNTSSAIVKISYYPAPNNADDGVVSVKFTSSTNIRFERVGIGETNSQPVYWEVVEFGNVNSIQSGSQYVGVGDSNITISAVDLSKSMVFASVRSYKTTTGYGFDASHVAHLTSTTNLKLNSIVSARSYEWQVIEFN